MSAAYININFWSCVIGAFLLLLLYQHRTVIFTFSLHCVQTDRYVMLWYKSFNARGSVRHMKNEPPVITDRPLNIERDRNTCHTVTQVPCNYPHKGTTYRCCQFNVELVVDKGQPIRCLPCP